MEAYHDRLSQVQEILYLRYLHRKKPLHNDNNCFGCFSVFRRYRQVLCTGTLSLPLSLQIVGKF